MQRGTINSTKTGVTSKKWQDQFTFDATGNWQTFKQDTDGNGTWETNQTRTHNKANEIATIAGSSSYVASDKNGNMTKLPKPDVWNAAFTCVYDAWNRMVQVKDGSTVVATYSYNGLNHRVKKVVGSETRLFYFNRNWQCLEERIGTTTDTQYVWGLRYVDDLVCRDKDSTRLYSLTDPNWNVAAIADTSGVIKERYVYSSFGKASVLSASFATQSPTTYTWNRLFTGQVLDAETGLMLYRHRFYHSGLGRFVARVPIGYDAEDNNLYRYINNRNLLLVDPTGTQKAPSKTGDNGVSDWLNNINFPECVDPYLNANKNGLNKFVGQCYGRVCRAVCPPPKRPPIKPPVMIREPRNPVDTGMEDWAGGQLVLIDIATDSPTLSVANILKDVMTCKLCMEIMEALKHEQRKLESIYANPPIDEKELNDVNRAISAYVAMLAVCY